jgi:hypothetical protein
MIRTIFRVIQWIGNVIVSRVLISGLSVLPLCLCGECGLRFVHHRDTENAKVAQRISQIRTPLLVPADVNS